MGDGIAKYPNKWILDLKGSAVEMRMNSDGQVAHRAAAYLYNARDPGAAHESPTMGTVAQPPQRVGYHKGSYQLGPGRIDDIPGFGWHRLVMHGGTAKGRLQQWQTARRPKTRP